MRAAQLGELGIETIKDLLYYAPFRYETVEREVTIANLQPETTVCIHAQVISKIPIKTARFASMLKVTVADQTGKLDLTWFNNRFILSSLKVGEQYYFTGKVSAFKGKPTITNPSVERETPEFGSLVPVYHESADITSRFLRKLVKQALEQTYLADDPKMLDIYKKHKLIALKAALNTLHRPEAEGGVLKSARDRLAFDEMFFLIKDVMEKKREHEKSASIFSLSVSDKDISQFYALLPYPPTSSQKDAIQNIAKDLAQPHPMQRLLQGEVGSGKTTVAAFLLWIAAKNNKKAILVCPTNILASQHFETLKKVFSSQLSAFSIGIYTGKEKSVDCDILVGTHALFTIKKFKPVIVIIDEEHRFGVSQRESFFQGKKKPHFLSMTATPIPRTVALTALADRDVSFILPHKSNSNIKTWVVGSSKRPGAYAWIQKTMKQTGQQTIVVCPFIEESVIETLVSVKSAKQEFERLKKVFSDFKLALLHGKIADKDKIFANMMSGKTDMLVTTPVVEVGVDIPKANVIVIEGAERFGLAQLHQLRGRVGRRGQDAYCLLFTSHESLATGRLTYFAKTYDGNALAEYDLKHRGSGELLGTMQHGFDTFQFASWSDIQLIETCKKELERR